MVAEHSNGKLGGGSLSAVTAASNFGPVTLLVAGSGCQAVADAASKVSGVDKVRCLLPLPSVDPVSLQV